MKPDRVVVSEGFLDAVVKTEGVYQASDLEGLDR